MNRAVAEVGGAIVVGSQFSVQWGGGGRKGRACNDGSARERGLDLHASLRACFCFQAEVGIRDYKVTGVQTCALPISRANVVVEAVSPACRASWSMQLGLSQVTGSWERAAPFSGWIAVPDMALAGCKARETLEEIGRASCRERGEISVGAVSLKKKKCK